MKLLSPIDVTVLTWLKPELDSTLHQARNCLEQYVEEGQGVAALRDCSQHLHQVGGILNMVELTGAARLAEEMEQLAARLAEDSSQASENAFSLLMQCIVQLPDYLERLQNGHRDVPSVLLPLINELRSIGNHPPLTEESVYTASTQLPIPEHVLEYLQSHASKKSFGELALQFQSHLMTWLHSPADHNAAKQLAAICEEIVSHCQEDASKKLFWVAISLLNALAQGKIESTKSIRQALTKIDQEVNYINNKNMGEARQNSPVRLTQELLYFVSQSPDATEQVRLVYDAFELAQNIPDEDEIKHAKSSLLGRNNALLQSVSAVIKEDILKVKDALDMRIRTQDATPGDLNEMVDVLSRIESTLGLIDANEAKNLIQKNKVIVKAHVDGVETLNESSLMEIAKSLLSVELMLDHKVADISGRKQAKMASDFLSSSQSHQLLDALIRESIVNFTLARQAYVAFVESFWEHSQLASIPTLLKQISGALAILEFTPVSSYIDAINAYTRVELMERNKVPNSLQMERLAEVLASLEYYLESVRDRRPNRERILEITEKSLVALNYWPIPDYALSATATPLAEYVAAVPVKAVVSVTVPESLPASEHIQEVRAPQTSAPSKVIVVDDGNECLQGFDLSAEGIDDEIREIFLEEFSEESGNLHEFLAQWKEAPDSAELIRPIRRVFHTLKGSGRLVGAQTLSDFSWKIESLLNRVLDGSRPASDAVISMLEVSISVLPKFYQALLGQTAYLDVHGLSDLAERLANGEESYYQAKHASAVLAASEESPASIAELAEVSAVQSEPIIDPVLLEILKPEINAHLETVNRWLTQAVSTENPIFEDALFRSIHTMNGAFSMTEVSTIAGVLSPAESLVRRAIAHNIGAKAEFVACLAQVADAVQATIDDLSNNIHPKAYPDLEAWVIAKRDELPEISKAVIAPMVLADMEAEHLESERIEAERVEAERVEAERVELEFIATQKAAAEFAAAELAAAEILEAERVEAERVEAERVEAERVEAERVESERVEAERIELEFIATQKAAAEFAAAELAAAESLEAERVEAERVEAERVEAERVEAERVEAERVEAERVELEFIATQKAAAEFAAAELAAAESLEAERVEAERVVLALAATAKVNLANKVELKHVGGKRGEAKRLEAKRLEAKRVAAIQAEAESVDKQNVSAELNVEKSEPVTLELLSSALVTNEHSQAVSDGTTEQEGQMESLDMSDLDEELLDIFTEEAKDLLDQSDTLLVQLKQAPDNFEFLFGIQRNLHTIKGGARMAGLFSIGELSHSLESLLQPNADQSVILTSHQMVMVEKSLDALHHMAHSVGQRQEPMLPEGLIAQLEGSESQAEPVHTVDVSEQVAEKLQSLKALSGPIESVDLDADEGLRTPQEVVRIRADLLDQLVNFAGEVAIYRARLEQQLGLFKINLVELDQTTSRLREQLRRLDIETEAQIAARNIREVDQGRQDFDPLELDRFTNQQQLSRSLAESSNDLVNLQATMEDLTRHHETLLLQQSRVSSELQEGLMRTRMLPFESLLPRLRRVLRQAAQDSNKEVQLRVEGAQGEMDRTVLDRMIAPLEHLLRNAVAHGIETAKERKKSGKSEIGNVVINIAHEGTEVVLSVRDDGRGLDAKQIQSKALERGLINADAELNEQQILNLITLTGFSTADTITRLSGRGIGMDVVSNEIKNLNGNLSIQTTPKKGTEFIIRLPLNLAVTKAVFVKIGENQYAIPIASVDGVGRIGREEHEQKMQLESPEFSYAGNLHKIYDLGGLLDLPTAKAEGSMQMPLLLSRSGQDRIAICVDQVLGSHEIVVKPIGPQVTSIPGVYGASIMPDGGVVVILDLAPLVRHNSARQKLQVVETVDSNVRSMPLVMVVDDSITMRKVTSRILERNNYEVILARDGLEAIEKMADHVPDLVLLDIEMPRMDGYEVAQNMKADSRLQNVPIMMITSRTGEKHRQRAFELGVERYLGKPYQEHELMRQVNEIFSAK